MAAPNPDAGGLGDRDEPESAPTPSPGALPGPAGDAGGDELPDDAVEERWADIVARLGELRASESEDAAAGDQTAAPSAAAVPVAGPRDWPASPEVEELEDAESHYTPPEPEPVLSRDPLLTLAWTLVVGVPVLTVVLVIVQALVPALSVPSWLGTAGGGLFLAAVAVLVWRMPHRRDTDDTGNGAVV